MTQMRGCLQKFRKFWGSDGRRRGAGGLPLQKFGSFMMSKKNSGAEFFSEMGFRRRPPLACMQRKWV